jgi:hypothetical protein
MPTVIYKNLNMAPCWRIVRVPADEAEGTQAKLVLEIATKSDAMGELCWYEPRYTHGSLDLIIPRKVLLAMLEEIAVISSIEEK